MIRFLNDPRDATHLPLIGVCSLVPFAAGYLFYLGEFSWWLAAVYLVVWGVLAERFTMMFHTTIHRRLFKKRHVLLEGYLNWFLGPFFGQTPSSFYVHHMGMHHVEDNLPTDLSSTMGYRRDSALQFVRYYLRFALLIPFELAGYLWRTGNTKLLRRFLVGELSFYGVVGLLAWWQWQPTVVVLVIPFVFVRLMMMIGNWVQHAFIDPNQPDNDYRNSVNTIDGPYNRRCFNAGYHIYHHLRKGSHFSELAPEFEANRERYGREDAIVFDGIDLMGIFILLLTKRHRQLARHFVHLPGAPRRTEEEVMELFQQRLVPIRHWSPEGGIVGEAG